MGGALDDNSEGFRIEGELKDFKIYDLEEEVRTLKEVNQKLKEGLAAAKYDFQSQIHFADNQCNEFLTASERWAAQYRQAIEDINDLSQENFNLKDELCKYHRQLQK